MIFYCQRKAFLHSTSRGIVMCIFIDKKTYVHCPCTRRLLNTICTYDTRLHVPNPSDFMCETIVIILSSADISTAHTKDEVNILVYESTYTPRAETDRISDFSRSFRRQCTNGEKY